jgi:hypothetical protein
MPEQEILGQPLEQQDVLEQHWTYVFATVEHYPETGAWDATGLLGQVELVPCGITLDPEQHTGPARIDGVRFGDVLVATSVIRTEQSGCGSCAGAPDIPGVDSSGTATAGMFDAAGEPL